jgi:hypothetical protein
MRNLLARWIRLHRKGAAIGLQRARQVYEAIQRANQARIDREILKRLDARTLRDIGMQSWNAELAGRFEAERQRRLMRNAAYRMGTY